jgi:hypothetical protein
MHILISMLLFILVSFAAFSEQGTMSTDDTTASQSEASMSGTTDDELAPVEAQEEEIRIEDDEYDPSMQDDESLEIDEEKMQKYRNEVQY